MLDIILWAIIAMFVTWEIVAFHMGNTKIHTLSWFLRRLEAFHGGKMRAVVGLAVVALFFHVVLEWF